MSSQAVSKSRRREPRHTRDAARALPTHFARNAILAAASKVFARHGIAAARVEDILLEAKIARRTFYKYFASKDDVLAALHELWTAELLRAIEAAEAEEPGDPLAGVRAGIDIFLGYYRSGPRMLREIVELAMRSDSVLAARRRWFRGELVKRLDAAVYALDRRRLHPFVFYGLLGALDGIALELGATEASADDVERARQVVHGVVERTLGLRQQTPLPRRLSARR